MRVSVLGPLRVTEGGRSVAVGGPRQRAVLIFLVLHANQNVPSERLVDELWGLPVPAGAGNALQAAVSRLRKVLPGGRLVTTPQGYLLRLTPDELDLSEFEETLTRGTRALSEGAAGDAAVMLRSALGLWRGPALVDVRFEPFAQAEIARLEEAHLSCREARLDAALALGGGGELVAELQQLVGEHPLREQLTGQLMLALYRGGRQAEALEAYRRTRTLLGEELGIDPSQSLARLERAVLRQEAWLEAGAHGPEGPGPGASGRPAASPRERPGGNGERGARSEESTEPPPRTGGPGPAVFAAGGIPALPTAATVTSSRRPVTVVCLDVESPAGSDPEMLYLVGERVRGLVRPVLERHGGRLLPSSGQRLLGVFGVPVPHEDDARRGAAAALDARAVLFGPAPGLTPVSCRVGVATGEALVSRADPLGFVGEVLGTAQALAEHAAPGQVLLSDQTHRLAAGAMEAGPIGAGRHELHGMRLGARSLPVLLQAPLLGREAELARIDESCAQASRQRSTVFVTVAGDAGMGKTRLVHELSSRLGPAATVITGRCLPYGEGVTFWPLREVVEQLTGGQTSATAVADVLRGEPDAPVVADRLTRAFGAGEPGTSDTAEIFWATRRLLEGAARHRLLVVALEDLHWAEPTFLDLVESIAMQPGTVPLVVLCVTRPDLLERRPDWLSAAARHTVVTLSPLADQDAAALAAALARPGALTEVDRERLVHAAGGNPFYLEQLVAAADELPSGVQDTPLPATVQALLASRLHLLGPAELEVLAAAAVVGKDFSTAAVAALLPRQVSDRLPWHLRTLAAKALVQPMPGGPSGTSAPAASRSLRPSPTQHSFRHILVQEATYRAVPKAARAALHERLADWAEADLTHGGTHRVEILGHHLAQATGYYRELAQDERADPLGVRAIRYLHQSGNASLAIGDAAAAVRALERALSLMASQDAERSSVLTGLGAALFESGRLAEARARLDEARRISRERALEQAEAHALVQSLLLDLHLYPETALEHARRDLPALREVFVRAGDDVGICRTWLLEAALHWSQAQSAAAERAWTQAARFARAADDHRHLTRSLRWLASAALWGPTPAGEGIARCTTYLQEIGSTPTGHAVISLHMAGLYAMSGHLSTARDLRARGTAVLKEVGSALPLVLAEPAALIATLAEDHAAAERHLLGAYEALRTMGEETDQSTCAALLARAVALQGSDSRGSPVEGYDRYDEVTAYVEISRISAEGQDLSAKIIGNGAMARVLAARGGVGEAIELAGAAVELAARTDMINQHGDALMDLAHVLRLAGAEDQASATARRARALYLDKENRLSTRQCDRFLSAIG